MLKSIAHMQDVREHAANSVKHNNVTSNEEARLYELYPDYIAYKRYILYSALTKQQAQDVEFFEVDYEYVTEKYLFFDSWVYNGARFY